LCENNQLQGHENPSSSKHEAEMLIDWTMMFYLEGMEPDLPSWGHKTFLPLDDIILTN
jgi:hypothetical protein